MWPPAFYRLFHRSAPAFAEGDASLAAGPRRGGFTLIELLVVVGVIALMTTLAIPAFNAIRGGTDFTSEVYNVAGMFDEARSYAMANNTFVLVGVVEVSATNDSSAASQTTGIGRIAMAIVASKNGTRPYQSLFAGNQLGNWYPATYGTGSAFFVPVTALMNFPNLHIVELQLSQYETGNMVRPQIPSSYYDLSTSNGASSTQFAWPLGVAGSSAQYQFQKVIEYDPQGSARIISVNNTPSYPNAVPLNLELGLEPAHGTAASTQQVAAIQINGISGASHIYRQ